MLVVMVIIALIAALVGPRLFPKLGKGKQSAAKAQIELLGQALIIFVSTSGGIRPTRKD
jgi:general secretion pathway protein G